MLRQQQTRASFGQWFQKSIVEYCLPVKFYLFQPSYKLLLDQPCPMLIRNKLMSKTYAQNPQIPLMFIGFEKNLSSSIDFLVMVHHTQRTP